MYYLSRVQLDPRRRKTMMALQNPNLFHGAVQRVVREKDSRVLWRVDTLRGLTYLLICTEEKPDLQSIIQEFGGEELSNMTKEYSGFLEKIHNGSCWRFRLQANPIKSKFQTGINRGKIVAHITTGHQEEWLKKIAPRNGFELVDGRFRVVSDRWISFKRKDAKRVSFRSVTFEGILTVTNEELFLHALTKGIGKEKAYGQGMLTIVHV